MKLVSALVGASVALIAAWGLFVACAPPPLPAETAITVTVSCAERDAGR